ncbi:MAG: hypothetical protein ACKV2U_32525 [Bryobacteraceae bacterium]
MLLRFGFLIPLFMLAVWPQKVEVVAADPVFFPGVADSNSPIHWANGMRYVYNSDGLPIRSEGADLAGMRYARATHLLESTVAPWWMEATHRDEDGTIYGWYHHERYSQCPMRGDRYTAVPVIGAVISRDNGHTFRDLGIILLDGYEPNCEAKNGYFAGGNGDFSVIVDREKKYFYFFFSAYGGPAAEQGVAVARMAYADRNEPEGKAWKYHDGNWESPGYHGKVTPIFAVRTPWESENTDAFWGPSVHYNRELGEFVMLLNRACCAPDWPAEGIYVSFNADMENPKGWAEPQRIVDGGGWYPMAVGLETGDTDKEAGARARFFMGSDSHWELIFRKGQTGVLPLPAQLNGKRNGVETRRHRRQTFK